MELSLNNQNLDNLVRIGQLQSAPFIEIEALRLLNIAHKRLLDSGVQELSIEGRFTSAYSAAHGAALAALRWHGYRSENELMVFQSLSDTLGWPANKRQAFDVAHQKRNLVEYDGYAEIQESTMNELRALATSLIEDVDALMKTPSASAS
jgi:hypothetical protein